MRFLVFAFLAFMAISPASAQEKASVYDRVIKSGEIRCGYFVAPPYMIKDPNTGALSGISHDYMEALAGQLGLKINWVTEIGLGDFVTALESDRIDAMCTNLWAGPDRARVVDYVTPITYHAVYAYTREDDTRFDNDYSKINDPSVAISYLDGDIAGNVADHDFPAAKKVTLPQLSPPSDAMLAVIDGKADVTIWSEEVIKKFNENNPKKLRQIPSKFPLRVFEEVIFVKRGEYDFVKMLDHTTRFMIDNGAIEAILKKYESQHSSFYRTSTPYETGKE